MVSEVKRTQYNKVVQWKTTSWIKTFKYTGFKSAYLEAHKTYKINLCFPGERES